MLLRPSPKHLCRGLSGRPAGSRKTHESSLGLRRQQAERYIFKPRRSMIQSSKSPTRQSDPEGHFMAHRFTIGVEEEFQIIDPADRKSVRVGKECRSRWS